MIAYPYAVPAAATVAWAGGAVGTSLAAAGVVVVATLLTLAFRAGRERVVNRTPRVRLAPVQADFPRAA